MGACCGKTISKEERDDLIEYLRNIDAEIEGLTLLFDGDRKYRENNRLRNSLKRDILLLSFNKESDVIRSELETRLKILRAI